MEQYTNMKARIPAVKELFQTRHYVQCITLANCYLTRLSEPMHPVHEAYLNFYMALSHDTMAREASLRNRHHELDLAEKHYLAAISSLSPPEPQQLQNIQEFPSPTSSSSEEHGEHRLRRASDAASLRSEKSTSTSATSLGDENEGSASDGSDPTQTRSNHFSRFSSSETSRKLSRRRPSPLSLSPPRKAQVYPTVVKTQFSSELSSFTAMVKTHLAGVRDLRDNAHSPLGRYSFTRSRSSSTISRPVSRDCPLNAPEMDTVRWSRKTTSFRPRFDPTSVRKLCDDTLAEL
ncbi:hypothetical protein EJ04DRAFT_521820 [Polyplosphaeria fusca]|uniref:Uncharacterized protein n=1 Tax=Polyplosphaeria fusca TaxID=682080 RepID=A0A9P4V3F1_9PLEO|nr:hypothetical protein EJ04DRAFT_521820 [Polyplosphaeria fusca]